MTAAGEILSGIDSAVSGAYQSYFGSVAESAAKADVSLGGGGKGCDSCPSIYDYKNKEVITNNMDCRDYMLYDNQWHQLPEEKTIDVFYPDSEHPQGGMIMTIPREQHFINNYVTKTVNHNFVRGAVGLGTAAGIFDIIKNQFKRSPVTAILGGIDESIRNTQALFERMNNHDVGVEHHRKNK